MKLVVICLKNRTFAVSQTTLLAIANNSVQLWFAWKIVLLQYRKQLSCYLMNLEQCCDLLEKSYFCSIANNFLVRALRAFWLWFAWKIVLLQYRKQLRLLLGNVAPSCDLLEKSYFCSIANNNKQPFKLRVQLWFAWKIVLLQYRKQPRQPPCEREARCDLLEKSYFCSIANNWNRAEDVARAVVICLKNRTFAVSQTTKIKKACKAYSCDLLEKSYFCSIANNLSTNEAFATAVVICLKNRTFAVSQTTVGMAVAFDDGCDLLEKSYFCSIANNLVEISGASIYVVICLKNRTFAVSQTTGRAAQQAFQQLWFAWKIVLLQYRKQRGVGVSRHAPCCDLLEKSYFCSIANNKASQHGAQADVVICLKNRTFAVSQTTCNSFGESPTRCDLLEKSYFCSIANNKNCKRALYS